VTVADQQISGTRRQLGGRVVDRPRHGCRVSVFGRRGDARGGDGQHLSTVPIWSIDASGDHASHLG
jgi:hypothetical protein